MRVAGLVALLSLAGAPQAVAANRWRIQSPPSHVDFGVRLLWVHTIRGRFERVSGTVTPGPDGRMVVDARVAAGSLAMESPRLRSWVLGEDFFDFAHHPTLHFVSVPVTRRVLDDGGTLEGELTLRGVTRPLQLDLRPAHCTADACTIEARGELRRGDFGMRGHHAMLSERVGLALSIAIARTPD